MPEYPDLEELDKLWPEEGYAIIITDRFKPPDSDDFVNILKHYDNPDFDLPSEKSGHYSYWVHDADGNSYSREEWQEYKQQHTDTE